MVCESKSENISSSSKSEWWGKNGGWKHFSSPPEILWSFLKFGFIFIPAANFVKTRILSSSQTTQTLSGKGEVVGEATDGQYYNTILRWILALRRRRHPLPPCPCRLTMKIIMTNKIRNTWMERTSIIILFTFILCLKGGGGHSL